MLILQRKVNETICIGDDVRVTVQSIERNRVQLAFVAPKSVPVHRVEYYAKLQAQKRRANGEGT